MKRRRIGSPAPSCYSCALHVKRKAEGQHERKSRHRWLAPNILKSLAILGSTALLVSLFSAACSTTSILAETPMNSTCREVPTIEECQSEAGSIEGACLRECVVQQCSGVKVVCSEKTQARCKFLGTDNKPKTGGYVERKDQMCERPQNEIAWCQLPMSRRCRAKAMVHELAHSGGWHHGDEAGVPGNSGRLQCQ